MIGSTAGTWLNYGTTVAFQILFARAFGTGAQASAFFIALVTAISLGSILSGTVHVIALPRLTTTDGGLHRGPLKLMAGAGVIAAILAVVTIVFADRLTFVISGGQDETANLIRAAGAFLVARVVASLVATVALARDHRFAPAAAPSVPSIVAAAYLIASPATASASSTLGFLALGSVAEIAILALLVAGRIRTVPGGLGEVRVLTLATMAQLGLLVALAPLQRIMSNVDSVTGAATAQYGLQGLQVGQQLLVGGLAVAAFADWSRLTSRTEIGAKLARTTAGAGLLLVFAGAMGAVAAPTIVRVLFQRGSFSASDTQAVVTIIRLGVVGFVAEGTALILAQGLVAGRHNWLAIRVSAFRFVVTATLTIVGGVVAGANGVAVAFSLGAVATLALIWPVTFRQVTVPEDGHRLLRRAAAGGAGIALATMVVTLLMPTWPDLVQATVVLVRQP